MKKWGFRGKTNRETGYALRKNVNLHQNFVDR